MDYTLGFLVFWSTLCTLVVAEAWRENRGQRLFFAPHLFWGFAILMACFELFRPIGIARDDQAYLAIFEGICPTLECGQMPQTARDWAWYLSVGILKSIWPSPRAMLLLGAIALFLKFSVIYSVAKRPLPVLLAFTSIYYQIQDLTAFRVAISSAVFLIAIWFYIRHSRAVGIVGMILSGVFHKQGFVAPSVLLGYLIKGRFWLLCILSLIPIGMMALGFYPPLQDWLSVLSGGANSAGIFRELDPYISHKLGGIYDGWRVAPVVFYPLIIFTLWMIGAHQSSNKRFDALMSGCLMMGCWFLWGFASLPDAQVRFFEFFMLPTILLVGIGRTSLRQTGALVLVSGIFVIKYNILHHLFI